MLLKVAMAQVKSTVGDLKGNIAKIRKFLVDAKECGADLVVFPELAVTGYPPQDLLLENGFVHKNKKILKFVLMEWEVLLLHGMILEMEMIMIFMPNELIPQE